MAILISWFSPSWKEIHDVFLRFFLFFNSVTSAATAYMSLLSFYECECKCGKLYIGETGRPMRDTIKKHDQDIRLACTETSAVSEHVHNTGQKPLWNEVKFINRDPYYYTRRVKESIHIRLHPDNINRDSGIEIPEAWMPTIKKHNNRRAVRQRTAEGANHWVNSKDRNAPIRAVEKQLITAEHHAFKITHDQPTSSPEEDQQYAVETSRSTSHVTTSWDKRKT